MDKTRYVCTLPGIEQKLIELALLDAGLSDEDAERGMNSRICDLEDTIDIDALCREW